MVCGPRWSSVRPARFTWWTFKCQLLTCCGVGSWIGHTHPSPVLQRRGDAYRGWRHSSLRAPRKDMQVDVLEAWRKSRIGRCVCSRCFYCDEPLDVHQHDHYPVPRRAGGSSVVPACLVCHDLKDRITLYNWDLEAAFRATQELFRDIPESIQSLPPERIFDECHLEIEKGWVNLSPLARVMYAKMRSIYEDRRYSQNISNKSSRRERCEQ